MTDALWLGVDVGTQSVKVSIVDDRGQVRGRGSAALASVREGDRHEQNPADWVAQSRAAMAVAVSALPHADRVRIAGLSVCATSGTITSVDARGTAVSTGLMYDDGRAGDLSGLIADVEPERWRRLGFRIQPTWALPKILWLVREGLLTEGSTIATQADVVAAAVTGGPVASDWSHSLKSGYDLLKQSWPLSVFAAIGVPEKILPRVVAPGALLGTCSAKWAESTGLPEGTPVFAGMTDGCAAQLGAGTLGRGDWHTVIGTTLVVKGVSDRIVVDDSGAVYSHRAPHDGLWFPGGASSAGAGALSAVLPGADLADRTHSLARKYAGRLNHIPLSYPLVGTGERFPIVRPDARGFVRLHGENRPLVAGATDDDDLAAAVFLGVACVERLAVETMTGAGVPVTGTFSSSGGATKNAWWTQLRADLLGREISVPLSAEGSVGMAILAAWGHGQRGENGPRLPEVAARMSPIGVRFEPNAQHRDVLDDRYRQFRELLQQQGWLAA